MTKVHRARYCDRGISIGARRRGRRDAQTVSNWPKGGPIRPEHCSAIELFTAGAVARRDLRPDDWHKIWPGSSSTRHCPSTLRILRAAAAT